MAIVISGTTGIDAGSLPVNNCGNTEVEGNLNLSGVGARITGDFSNATYGNRVAFQTSVTNSYTTVAVIPNGTATNATFQCYSSSDMNNSTRVHIGASATVAEINSSAVGTANYVPLVFITSATERMRIDTAGNVLVTNSTGGLGYGTGAGGTVTQLTSKSTAVTLNKPTGLIIMNNAALAAGASVAFTLLNSLAGIGSNIIANPQGSDNYSVEVRSVFNNGGTIYVTNKTAGSLSEAVQIQFSIIKGATA